MARNQAEGAEPASALTDRRLLFAIAERVRPGGLALLMRVRVAYSEDVLCWHKVPSNACWSATPRTDAGSAGVGVGAKLRETLVACAGKLGLWPRKHHFCGQSILF